MLNRKFKTILLALLLATSAAACKKKKGDGGGGGGGIGVAECDDYLAKMAACAKKSGGPAGEGLTKMANMMSKAWKEEVADAGKKAEMPKTCKGAIKDMKKQFPDCDWGIADEPKPPEGGAAAGSADGSAAPAGSADGSAAPAGSAAAGSAATP